MFSTSKPETLTEEEIAEMKKLVGKYTFNDLRKFVKDVGLQLILSNNTNVLDDDLFKYNFYPQRYFEVFDPRLYAKLEDGIDTLVKLANNDEITDTSNVYLARTFLERNNISEKKFNKICKRIQKGYIEADFDLQEIIQQAKHDSVHIITFNAKSLKILSRRLDLIEEHVEDWQKYLNQTLTNKKSEEKCM